MSKYSNLDCCVLGSNPGFVTGCPARFQDTDGHDCQRVFSNECTGDALFGSKCANYCQKHEDECARRKAAYCRTSNDPQCTDIHPGQDEEPDDDDKQAGDEVSDDDSTNDSGDDSTDNNTSEDDSDDLFPFATRTTLIVLTLLVMFVVSGFLAFKWRESKGWMSAFILVALSSVIGMIITPIFLK